MKRGRKQGIRSRRIQKRIDIILNELVGAMDKGEWDRYWSINDMTSLAYEGDTYLTPDKKAQTRYALGTVRRTLRDRGMALFSVPGKGYRLWPDLAVLTDPAMMDQMHMDAKRVALKWAGYIHTLAAPQGPLATMKDRGTLAWSGTESNLLTEAGERIIKLTE